VELKHQSLSTWTYWYRSLIFAVIFYIFSMAVKVLIFNSISCIFLKICYTTDTLETRERTIIGSVSYRIRYWAYPIVSNRIGYFCIGQYYMHHCRFSSC